MFIRILPLLCVVLAINNNDNKKPAECQTYSQCDKEFSETALNCGDSNITFYLFTTDGITNYSQYVLNAASEKNLSETPFLHNTQIKLLVLGYNSSLSYLKRSGMIAAYQRSQKANIIFVDYSAVTPSSSCYSFNIIPMVTACTAQLLASIYRFHTALSTNVTHIVAHGEGALIAGYLGKYDWPQKFWRITALDPTPLELGNDSGNLPYPLDRTSTQFIDCYITNLNQLGMGNPFCNALFYFNDGKYQPGCDGYALCSHNRAFDYFVESIDSQLGFWGVPCMETVTAFIESLTSLSCTVCESTSNVVLVGDNLAYGISGTFHVSTDSKSPYAQGNASLTEYL